MSFIGGLLSAGGSILGANASKSAATQAANAQVQSAQIASQTQRDALQQARNALQPYLNLGNNGTYEMQRLMADNENGATVPTFTDLGTVPTSTSQLTPYIATPQVQSPMTQADLEATPGYQFTLSQGLKATQNSAAARGLGLSGAALKGASTYATGLSDQTYNTRFQQGNTLFNEAQTGFQDQYQQNQARFAQQGTLFDQAQQQFADQYQKGQGQFAQQQGIFDDTNTNLNNRFNRLYQTAGLGLSAGSALAGQSVSTGQGIANTQVGSGNAQAAGINTGGQATAAAYTGTAGAFNNALNQYLYAGGGSGLFGGGSSYQGWMPSLFGG